METKHKHTKLRSCFVLKNYNKSWQYWLSDKFTPGISYKDIETIIEGVRSTAKKDIWELRCLSLHYWIWNHFIFLTSILKVNSVYIVDSSNKLIIDNLVSRRAYSIRLNFHLFCWQNKVFHFKGRPNWTALYVQNIILQQDVDAQSFLAQYLLHVFE